MSESQPLTYSLSIGDFIRIALRRWQIIGMIGGVGAIASFVVMSVMVPSTYRATSMIVYKSDKDSLSHLSLEHCLELARSDELFQIVHRQGALVDRSLDELRQAFRVRYPRREDRERTPVPLLSLSVTWDDAEKSAQLATMWAEQLVGRTEQLQRQSLIQQRDRLTSQIQSLTEQIDTTNATRIEFEKSARQHILDRQIACDVGFAEREVADRKTITKLAFDHAQKIADRTRELMIAHHDESKQRWKEMTELKKTQLQTRLESELDWQGLLTDMELAQLRDRLEKQRELDIVVREHTRDDARRLFLEQTTQFHELEVQLQSKDWLIRSFIDPVRPEDIHDLEQIFQVDLAARQTALAARLKHLTNALQRIPTHLESENHLGWLGLRQQQPNPSHVQMQAELERLRAQLDLLTEGQSALNRAFDEMKRPEPDRATAFQQYLIGLALVLGNPAHHQTPSMQYDVQGLAERLVFLQSQIEQQYARYQELHESTDRGQLELKAHLGQSAIAHQQLLHRRDRELAGLQNELQNELSALIALHEIQDERQRSYHEMLLRNFQRQLDDELNEQIQLLKLERENWQRNQLLLIASAQNAFERNLLAHDLTSQMLESEFKQCSDDIVSIAQQLNHLEGQLTIATAAIVPDTPEPRHRALVSIATAMLLTLLAFAVFLVRDVLARPFNSSVA